MGLEFHHPRLAGILAITGMAIVWFLYKRHRPRFENHVFKIAAWVCLGLLLSGARLSLPSSEPRVIALLDASGSLRPFQEIQLQTVQDWLASGNPARRVTIAWFAERLAVAAEDRHPAEVTALTPPGSAVGGPGTSLTTTLPWLNDQVARAPVSQVVCFTDAGFSGRDGGALARLAAAHPNIQWILVDVTETLADAAIVEARRQRTADGAAVEFSLRANRPMTTAWRLWSGSRLLREGRVELSPIVMHREQVAIAAEAAALRVELAVADAIEENNVLGVGGGDPERPRALRIATAAVSPLPALAPSLEWTTVAPVEATPEQCRDAVLLVIDDVPAAMVPAAAQTAIRQAVENGAALWMLGLEHHLGAGGWQTSLLEPVLPVHCVPQRQEPAWVLLLVDRSGSMSEIVAGDTTRLQIVKDAVSGAILPALAFAQGDRIGLLAFRDQVDMIADPRAGEQSAASVQAALQSLRASGRTAVLPALRAAQGMLEQARAENAELRLHCVVLSDGKSTVGGEDAAEYAALGERLRDLRVAVTVLGAGGEQDRLREFAAAAGGDWQDLAYENLHELLRREAGKFSGWVRREPVAVAGRGEPWESFEFPDAAAVVISSPKDGATVAATANDQPLLAYWPVGSGAAGVFNAALRADSLPAWEAWERMGDWMTAWLERLGTTQPPSTARLRLDWEADGWTLHVDRADPAAFPLNHAYSAVLRAEDGGETVIPLDRPAADGFRGRLPALAPGSYGAVLRDDGGRVLSRGQWLAVRYHPEWSTVGPNREIQQTLIQAGSFDRVGTAAEIPAARPVALADPGRTMRILAIVTAICILADLAWRAWQRRRQAEILEST